MGSLFNRGTKAKPRWVMQFKEGGRFVQRPSKFKSEGDAEDELEDIESRIRRGEAGWVDPDEGATCGELFPTWSKALANRNADDDRTRITRYLAPMWKHQKLVTVKTEHVMAWIDDMRAGTAPVVYAQKKGKRVGKLSGASMRANLNLLSRFFSWCVERGHAQFNPVRQVPTGRRPQQAAKTDTPWLADIAIVRKLIDALPSPFDLMFYIGHFSGMRTGEICGLRMADLEEIAEGRIRVRFTYDGAPLKEDKHSRGLSKVVPAPADSAVVLGQWLATRKAEGAEAEDLVFRRVRGKCKGTAFDKQDVSRAWDAACEAVGVADLTWYQATRHSFVSRSLKAGASLDEVSAAVGHSSPTVTRRWYDHMVRRDFSATMRQGLGRTESAEPGKVLTLPKQEAV